MSRVWVWPSRKATNRRITWPCWTGIYLLHAAWFLNPRLDHFSQSPRVLQSPRWRGMRAWPPRQWPWIEPVQEKAKAQEKKKQSATELWSSHKINSFRSYHADKPTNIRAPVLLWMWKHIKDSQRKFTQASFAHRAYVCTKDRNGQYLGTPLGYFDNMLGAQTIKMTWLRRRMP